MSDRYKWLKYLGFAVTTYLIIAVLVSPFNSILKLQSDIRIFQGEERQLKLEIPFALHTRLNNDGIIKVNENKNNINNDEISFEAINLGETTLEFRLFDLIPIRQMTVNVVPEMKVMPGGHSIGIKIKSEGVMVVGFSSVENNNNTFSPAKQGGLRKGDSITEINGIKIDTLQQASELIKKSGGSGKELEIKLKRDGKNYTNNIVPVYCESSRTYRIGLYIRDTAAGVGTMSFYDIEDGIYGALGHVVADVDTQKAIDIKNGEIVNANIINIQSAKKGQPGEKNGIFIDEKNILGDITKNTNYGIFGTLNSFTKHPLYNEPISVGLSEHIEIGKAKILTVIEGREIESFEIEIRKVLNQNEDNDKSMVIEVTDPVLLEATGGIVQGMSGSPIIQNNKIVGAVTHVFVNNPTRGYGIFIEKMLEDSGMLESYS